MAIQTQPVITDGGGDKPVCDDGEVAMIVSAQHALQLGLTVCLSEAQEAFKSHYL